MEPREIVGYSQDDFATALEVMESTIDMGQKARITICTEGMPTHEELDSIYWGMIAEGCHVSRPTADLVEGIPTTEFTLQRGSPQWQLIIPILVPLFTIGLIAWGITQLPTISKALMPLLITTVIGIIGIAIIIRRPAEKYIERGGPIPRLPETKKALAAR